MKIPQVPNFKGTNSREHYEDMLTTLARMYSAISVVDRARNEVSARSRVQAQPRVFLKIFVVLCIITFIAVFLLIAFSYFSFLLCIPILSAEYLLRPVRLAYE